MKTLLTISTLVFTVMFSSTSFAEWTKLARNAGGDDLYVDFERIRKHSGYVYYWELLDRLKPSSSGDLSSKAYVQGDCELFRVKRLSYVFHKQPMGRDAGDSATDKNPEWHYPSPNSLNEIILESVCSR